MGLIKSEYIVKGVSISPCYAKITRFYIENDNVRAKFGLSSTRENIENGLLLDEVDFVCKVDKKEDKLFNEIYTKSKEELFKDWEDDIHVVSL